MTISKKEDSKMVLIFNSDGRLQASAKSVNSAARLTKNTPQAVSQACTGKLMSSKSMYYRFFDKLIEIEESDHGSLSVQEYDQLIGGDNLNFKYKKKKKPCKKKSNKQIALK